MSYEGENYESPIVNLVTEVGPAPEGVDQIDYIIATLPPKTLTRAAKDSTFSYEGLQRIIEDDPEFLGRYDADPHPSKTLADEILERQHKLSAPRRRLATVASIAVVALGGFIYGYGAGKEGHREVLHPNSNTPQQQAGDKSQGIEVGAVLGGLSGTLAGFTVYLSSLSLAGRMARRPAQKLVDKTRTSA